MPRTTTKLLVAFVLLGWFIVLQHARGRDLVAAREMLVSRVTLGSNPTSGFGNCATSTGVSTAVDTKSYPANGSYLCPNGNQGNLGANPNPLVASCNVPCIDNQKYCGSSFGSPGSGSDETGPFAEVSSTERRNPGPPPDGCSPGTTRYFKSYTSKVYDTSALCQGGGGPSCSYNGTPCLSDGECCSGICNSYEGYLCSDNYSPLLLDLRSNAVEYGLTSATDGVLFDINGDGDLDRVAWTAAGAPVAFLVLDRNGNGLVDNGQELFGMATPTPAGGRFGNGFDALRSVDNNRDGQVDSQDASYASLRLWIDANHDGKSTSGELSSLSARDVISISTTYWPNKRVDRYGNKYRLEGAAVILANRQEHNRRVFDVFLVVQGGPEVNSSARKEMAR